MIWGYPYFRKPPFMEQTWDVNGSRMSCEEFDPSNKRALKKCIYVDPTFESLTEITQKCIHMLGLDKVDKQTIASKIAFLPRNNSWIYLSIDRSIDHNFGVKKLVFRVFSASFCVILLVLPNVTDRGQNQQLFDFWSLTTFQSRPKKCSFWMSRYIYIYIK